MPPDPIALRDVGAETGLPIDVYSRLLTRMSIFKGIRFLAILVGWLVDEGLSQTAFLSTEIFFVTLQTAGFNLPTLWYTANYILGSGGTVVGAFVTGCIAKSHRLKNGLILGVYELVVYYNNYYDPSSESLLWCIFRHSTDLGSALLGAWIAKLILGPGHQRDQRDAGPNKTA